MFLFAVVLLVVDTTTLLWFTTHPDTSPRVMYPVVGIMIAVCLATLHTIA